MGYYDKDSIFDNPVEVNVAPPLAAVLRPKSLSEVVGQEFITREDGLVGSVVSSGKLLSIIFAGPPGTGKTTIARLVASELKSRLVSHIATSFGVKDIKEITAEADRAQEVMGLTTIVFVDEIHRLTKVQSDALLSPIEEGRFFLFGATTENPWMSVSPALLSRVHVVELQPLDLQDVETVIEKAANFTKVTIDNPGIEWLYALSGGDLRIALNIFEAAAVIASKRSHNSRPTISQDDIQAVRPRASKGISASDHFEMTSALIKSMRASNADAALYWLARLLVAGEDPRFIARRLVVFASEDIGLSDSEALLIASATYSAAERIGMPEIRINLGHCVAYLSRCQKSRVAYDAIDYAMTVAAKTMHLGVPHGIRGEIEEIERKRGRLDDSSQRKDYFPGGLSATKFLRDET